MEAFPSPGHAPRRPASSKRALAPRRSASRCRHPLSHMWQPADRAVPSHHRARRPERPRRRDDRAGRRYQGVDQSTRISQTIVGRPRPNMVSNGVAFRHPPNMVSEGTVLRHPPDLEDAPERATTYGPRMSLLVVGVELDYVLVASDSRSCHDGRDGEVLVDDARQKLFVQARCAIGLVGDNGVADAMLARLRAAGPAVSPESVLARAALAAADVGWRSGQANRTCSVVLADYGNGPAPSSWEPRSSSASVPRLNAASSRRLGVVRATCYGRTGATTSAATRPVTFSPGSSRRRPR